MAFSQSKREREIFYQITYKIALLNRYIQIQKSIFNFSIIIYSAKIINEALFERNCLVLILLEEFTDDMYSSLQEYIEINS